MRSYDEISADAKDERPFSNGTEGYAWMDNHCYWPCKKDRNEDCPLVMVALLGHTPREWTEKNPGSLGDQYECAEFEPDDEDDGEPEPEPGPQPVAVLDGQIDLFEVFADRIAEQASTREAVTA